MAVSDIRAGSNSENWLLACPLTKLLSATLSVPCFPPSTVLFTIRKEEDDWLLRLVITKWLPLSSIVMYDRPHDLATFVGLVPVGRNEPGPQRHGSSYRCVWIHIVRDTSPSWLENKNCIISVHTFKIILVIKFWLFYYFLCSYFFFIVLATHVNSI